jgi:hypothetical protein
VPTETKLDALLSAVEPALRLVHERHLRQLLNYFIDRGRALPTNTNLPFWFSRADLVAADVLPPSAMRGTEERLLLVTNPDDRMIAQKSRPEQLRIYWRVLFRAAVMKTIDAKVASGALDAAKCRERLNHFGVAAAREIRFVLETEHDLAPEADDIAAFRMFAAMYLDLDHFTAHAAEEFFPALPHGHVVRAFLAEDIPISELIASSRPAGAPDPERPPPEDLWSAPPAPATPDTAPPPPEGIAATLQRATEAEQNGNVVRAAILRTQAAMASQGLDRERAMEGALAAVRQLVDRLGDLLDWDQDTRQEWRQAIGPLLPVAASGAWPRAARCLYELQRIPADYSREIYAVEIPEYIRTLGRRPVRRHLPHARPVMMLMAFRKAHKHLLRSKLGEPEQLRIDRLMHHEIHRREHAIRHEFAPIIVSTLTAAGLVPTNRVEEVARDKLVAELLDRICERGYLRLGDLRDGVARNQLKLQNLRGPGEFVSGDPLLRADTGLAYALDGVYRRGEFYLRWIQRFVSVFFGTPWGRALVLYLAVPFGGAFLMLVFAEELRHLGGAGYSFASRWLGPRPVKHQPPQTEATIPADGAPAIPPPPAVADAPLMKIESDFDEEDLEYVWQEVPDVEFEEGPGLFVWESAKDRERIGQTVTTILTSSESQRKPEEKKKHVKFPPIHWPTLAGLGVFILLVLHVRSFRRAVGWVFSWVWRVIRGVLWDLPSAMWQSRPVRTARHSSVVRFLHRHLATPLMLTLIVIGILVIAGVSLRLLSWYWWIPLVALLIAYNTRVGWEIQEHVAEALADWWRRVRVNFIPGLIATFIDLFQMLANWVERRLYAVDEWMRFRTGDSQGSLWVKALLHLMWFPIAYLTRFVFYLLAEPQFNPVKHFPVVTVSHKVLAPLLLMMVPTLADFVGDKTAGTIYFFTQLLLPGVFGFLAWELKENWRLYAANRSALLPRAIVGSHGESMRGMLRPGFHSGTVPKVYRKTRKALEAGDAAKVVLMHHDLEHAAEGVQRFAERELIPLLAGSREWGGVAVEVATVRLAVQRAEFVFRSPLGRDPFILALENMNGTIEASIAATGWTDKLTESQRRVLCFALRGVLDIGAAAKFEGRERSLDAPEEPGFGALARRVTWDEWVKGWSREEKGFGREGVKG